MRAKVIQQIVRTNILYTLLPKQAKKFRDKQTKSKGSTGTYLIKQNLWTFLIFGVFYGLMFFFIPLETSQAAYTSLFALFTMIALINFMLTIINVFFESKDFGAYRHLPISSQELIVGKGISVLVYSGPYLCAPIILLFVLAVKVKTPLYISLPMAFLMSLLVLTFLISLGLITVYLTLNTTFFKKHKEAIFSFVLPLMTFISYFSFYAIQYLFPFLSNVDLFNKILGIFYLSISNPFSLEFLLHFAVWVVGIIILITLVIKVILPKFYDLSYEIATTSNKKSRVAKKTSSKKSIQRNLVKYNVGLIFDQTNFITLVVNPLVFPTIMIFSISNNIRDALSYQAMDNRYVIISLLLGLIIAILSASQNSFLGTSISLDRENFSFIKAMPFSMALYLKVKFFVAFIAYNFFPIGLLVILGILIKAPILYVVFAIIGYLGTAYGLSQFLFKLDYDHLNLDWQNLEQLFGRGMGKGVQIFAKMVAGFVFIALTIYLVFVISIMDSQATIVLTIAVLAIYCFILIFVHLRYRDRFWKTLN